MTDSLDALKPDPRNARTHSQDNLDLISNSLREVGAARSIVVDEDNVILAGNATVQAARAAGLTHVQVVDADGETVIAVRRSGLSPEQKRRLALFDNRAGELADWDRAVLLSLAKDTDLSGLWCDDDLSALLGEVPQIDFPEYDESAAEEVAHVTCPACGHSFPAEYLQVLEAAWSDTLASRLPGAPTVVSCFAGGGGSTLGCQRAGYRELLATDWDERSVETLRLNLPDLNVWQGDIAELSVEQVLMTTGLVPGQLDVLDGSPPCQGFSTAGKRVLADSRNELFREFVRLLRGLQPRFFVMENVAGMVRGKMRLVFADCIRELKASGYRVSARVLDSMYFCVPQHRQRLIIIGVRDDLGIELSHPAATTWPVPIRVALEAAKICGPVEGDADTPALSDAYGQLWSRIPQGRSAIHLIGKGFSSCVKPHPDRPSPTLMKTQTGRGFATTVHPSEQRALSIREAALIGSYPPQFRFVGSYSEQWARIGNSVPPLLMRAIAEHLRTSVLDAIPARNV
jgi:DNA (cytosine-5)-methyltransferase 1